MKFLTSLWLLIKLNFLNVVAVLIFGGLADRLDVFVTIGTGMITFVFGLFTIPILCYMIGLLNKLPYSADSLFIWFGMVVYLMHASFVLVFTGSVVSDATDIPLLALVPAVFFSMLGSRKAIWNEASKNPV
jgi:putative Ca2+/H+ antiporter (TMEM165/GDT1 family)